MNSYHGLHARFYDLVYADKPYAEEAAFVAGLLADEGVSAGRLLDVACGTGRHAAELAARGFAVTGVDYNDELLALARERAPGAVFLLQDMRDLQTDGSFDAVTSFFDAVGYPIEDAGVAAAVESMAGQLRPGGVLVLEFMHAPALRAGASPVRVRRYPAGGHETLLRISETAVDPETNVLDVSYELLLLDEESGRFARWRETQRNRAFEVAEIEGFMRAAGLDGIRFLTAYGSSERIDEDVWHVLAVARAT